MNSRGIKLFIILFCLMTFTLVLGQAYGALKSPTNLKVISIYTNSVKLTWDKVNNVDGYELNMYNMDTRKSYNRTYNGANITNVLRDNMIKGNNYKFKVRAYNKVGNKKTYSTYSNTIQLKTMSKNTLSIPSNLHKIESGTNYIKLAWNNVTYADGYELYMINTNTGKNYTTKYEGINNVSITRGSLTPSNNYKFKVRAYKKDVNGNTIYSSYTSWLTASTLNKVTTLQTPTNLREIQTGTNYAELSWSSVPNADGYELYMTNTNTNQSNTTKYYGQLTTTIIKSNLISANNYTFKVRAYKTENQKIIYSNYTSKINVKTKSKTTSTPSNVNSPITIKVDPEATRFEAVWNNIQVSGYEVILLSGEKTIDTTKVSTPRYAKIGLDKNTTYTLKVRPYIEINNKKTYGSYTITTFKTLDKDPAVITLNKPTIKVSDITRTTFKISWDKIENATGYVIYYKQENEDKYKEEKVGINTLTKEIKDLKADTKYKVYLKAYNTTEGETKFSDSSNTITLETKVITTPLNFKAELYKENNIKATWDKLDGATGYAVYIYDETKLIEKIKVKGAENESYIKENLAPNKKYKIRIRAYKEIKDEVVYSSPTETYEIQTKDAIVKKQYGGVVITETASKNRIVVDADLKVGNVVIFDQLKYPTNLYGCTSPKISFPSSSSARTDKRATILTHGCGTTSMAIILSTFFGYNKYGPVALTDSICCSGFCTSSGTAYSVFTNKAKLDKWGVTGKQVSSWSSVEQALETGNSLVLLSVRYRSSNVFTNGSGHFIVLAGMKNGQVYVVNPINSKKPSGFYSPNEVKNNKKVGYYIISKK